MAAVARGWTDELPLDAILGDSWITVFSEKGSSGQLAKAAVDAKTL